MRVYAMVLPIGAARRLGSIFRGAGEFMAGYAPQLKSDMATSEIDLTAEQYMVGSVFSAALLGAGLFLFAYVPMAVYDLAPGLNIPLALAPALLIAFLDFFILMKYPRILSLKRAQMIERDLIYALKEIILNLSAGLSLFESIRRVSEGDHGIVSKDFDEVVKDAGGGMPLDESLKRLALKTPSEHMRNALWQTVNAVKSGTSVKVALSGIIDSLVREQNRRIMNYIQELNVMIMIYMLFAVAIPTIITTVLVVLTALMGTGITEQLYIFAVISCILVQIALVGFIKSRRPLIYVG